MLDRATLDRHLDVRERPEELRDVVERRGGMPIQDRLIRVAPAGAGHREVEHFAVLGQVGDRQIRVGRLREAITTRLAVHQAEQGAVLGLLEGTTVGVTMTAVAVALVASVTVEVARPHHSGAEIGGVGVVVMMAAAHEGEHDESDDEGDEAGHWVVPERVIGCRCEA